MTDDAIGPCFSRASSLRARGLACRLFARLQPPPLIRTAARSASYANNVGIPLGNLIPPLLLRSCPNFILSTVLTLKRTIGVVAVRRIFREPAPGPKSRFSNQNIELLEIDPSTRSPKGIYLRLLLAFPGAALVELSSALTIALHELLVLPRPRHIPFRPRTAPSAQRPSSDASTLLQTGSAWQDTRKSVARSNPLLTVGTVFQPQYTL